MILQCSCISVQQDKLYGSGRRVFNECKSKSSGTVPFRCTVCGRMQDRRVDTKKKGAE